MLDAITAKVIAAPIPGLAGLWFAGTAPIVALIGVLDDSLPDEGTWGALVRQVPGQVGLIIVVGMGLKVGLVVLRDMRTNLDKQGEEYRTFTEQQTSRFESAVAGVGESHDKCVEAIVANREALRELIESHKDLASEVRAMRLESGHGRDRIP